MSKVISEEKKVYGTLETDFGSFYMLQEFPTKNNVPWYLKDHQVLSFYVYDPRDKFSKNILVAGNNWLIRSVIEDIQVQANFVLEDVEETQDVQA